MTYLKIIFICMGNSCSSPMAEAIMQNLMVKTSLYWEVDSAALRNWNIGRRPHKYCLRVLHEHGLRSKHFCRLLSNYDFQYFDYIIPMNNHVHKELMNWVTFNRITDTSKIVKLTAFSKLGRSKTLVNLTQTSKLKSFRAGYYKIKSHCKQIILSQHVDIIKYELPSTDDEDDKNQKSLSEATQSRNDEQHVNLDLSGPITWNSMTSSSNFNSQSNLDQSCSQNYQSEQMPDTYTTCERV